MIKNFKAYSKLLSRLGLVVVIPAIIYIWGAAIVANVANFWNVFTPGGQERFATYLDDSEPVLPPRLNPLGKAVKDPKLTVSGTTQEGFLITIYLNGNPAGNVRADKNGRFSFDGLNLNEGENEIYAKATNSLKIESVPSLKSTVKYLKKPPPLEIINLPERTEIRQKSNLFTLRGRTHPEVTITVNGSQAFVDGDGNFSFALSLLDGENRILVESLDKAGNKTVLERTINYYRE